MLKNDRFFKDLPNPLFIGKESKGRGGQLIHCHTGNREWRAELSGIVPVYPGLSQCMIHPLLSLTLHRIHFKRKYELLSKNVPLISHIHDIAIGKYHVHTSKLSLLPVYEVTAE